MPSDLSLAVSRVAGVLGVRAAALVGPLAPALDVELELTHVADAASGLDAYRDGLVVLCDHTGWSGLDAARVVVAFANCTDDPPLVALARMEAAAAQAGWRIAHAGLLLATSPDDAATRHEHPLVIACKPDDDELMRLLDNGPLSIALDPVALATPRATRPARVLIASYEVTGPTGNGGIGTAYHSLAHSLAAAGHDVMLLFTGWLEPERARQEPEWRESFARAGIDFAFLGTPWDLPVRSPHHAVRRAYELHRWLLEAHARKPFDVVHVPECLGHGAFAQTAKALGLAYADVEFVVGTHSSTRWVAESNRESLESIDQLVTERLERISVERADVVMSPSAYLLNYMRDRRWALPQRTFVQQYARPQSVRRLSEGAQPAGVQRTPSELVFFGRLETRKGLEAFCDAVDVLVEEGDCPFTRITLLGRPEQVMGEDATTFVERRAARWRLPWKVLPELGHAEAIAYLRSHACVVAIPSLVDNSPNTVSEAIALGVPFVASRSGGTAELIAPGDLATSSFDGWQASTTLEPPTFADAEAPFDARALAEALRAKAGAPGTRVAPAIDDAACDRVYDEWHRAMAARERSADDASTGGVAGRLPSAAVCVVASTSSDALRVASSVRKGSRAPQAIVAVCHAVADAPADGDVAIVQAGGRDAGRARDRATAALDADVLIVLRENEQPDATLVERVCTAMAHGDAEILSLVCRDPHADRQTGIEQALRRTDVPDDLRAFVPAPGPAIAAVAYPALAVGPYAIRRAALAELGGYAHDVWGETVDHELLSRAALAGLRIDVLPEPVATTVDDDAWTEVRTHYWDNVAVPVPTGENQIRRLRPFRRLLDDDLADLPALLTGAMRAAGTRVAEDADRRRQLVDAYEQRVREQRELIALYEQRQEEMRAALASACSERPHSVRAMLRLQRAMRGPMSEWPARGVRFARWRLILLGRRLRARR